MTHSDLHNELAPFDKEPLLPIEKKLIAWSLGLGIVLLVALALANNLFPLA
jgi:hypothetical protein